MKQNNKRNNRRRKGKDNITDISYVRSNKKQQLTTLTFPILSQKISLVASPTFSFSLQVDAPNDILDSDPSSIVSKFAGWRISNVKFHLVPLSTTLGSSVFFFSDTIATPSNFKSYTRNTYPNSTASASGYWMTWAPRDYADLEFNDSNVPSTVPVLNFYGYSNTTELGVPAGTTADLWTIAGTVTFQLRGLSI